MTPSRELVSPFDLRYLSEGFRSLLPVDGGVEGHLRGVVEDVLGHPGSLVRAQLAYSVLRRHAVDAEPARELAVAIEYFHTASLVFDDMPAMDDAEERRGHPCPHRVYGEAAATLGALALINQGYALLWRTLGRLEPARSARAAELVNHCLGLRGILDGQARDLHFDPTTAGEADVLRVAEGKTGTLIRLTLLLPAIVGGAAEEELGRLDRLATVWGLAYQITDDFKDSLMSRDETGKSTRRDGELGRPNLPGVMGSERAYATLEALLDEGRDLLAAFDGERWGQLASVQEILEQERRKVAARLPLSACA
jgi:geranylgeranyl pyrophosphate synthase